MNATMKGSAGVSRCLLLAIVLLALGGRALAEPLRAPGSSTGDGSTSFTGLAQAPEANLFVGAATTSIPFEVPPGRKNLTPTLALTYSSSGGPSPYGYGWDLPLGKIQRSTKHGVLSCTDAMSQKEFVLVLPGASVECRLQDNPPDPNNWRCIPVVEEAFLRIQLVVPANRWEVWDKSGLHYFFGEGTNERTGKDTTNYFMAGAQGCQPGTQDCPCGYTFSWALDRIDDPNGNRISIQYISDSGILYPDRVLYGGNVSAGLGDLFKVNFVWSNEDGFSRPAGDNITNSIGGFQAKLTRLLSRVEVWYLTEEQKVRSYELHYEFQTATLADDRVGRQSFLVGVTLFNGNGSALARADADATPADTTFLYHDNFQNFAFSHTPQTAVALPIANSSMGRLATTTGTNIQSVRDILDMNGDGIPDLVDASGCPDQWNVYFGSNAGFSPTPTPWSATAYEGLPGEWVTCTLSDVIDGRTNGDLIDMNGDGIPDLVDASGTTWQVQLGHAPTGGKGWGFDNPIPWPAPAAYTRVGFGDRDFRGHDNGSWDIQDLIDMNGDGLRDLVQGADSESSATWQVSFNTGSGFTAPIGVPAPFGPLRFTDSAGLQVLGLYDMNGDGLPDQVLTWDHSGGGGYTGYWQVYLNTGYQIGPIAESWALLPSGCGNGLRQSLYDNTDVVRDFFDINGDGLPDVVETCGWTTFIREWQVYLNRGDGFEPAVSWWSPSGVIRNLDDHNPGGQGRTFADTFDVDGDGLVDIVDFQSDASHILIYHNAGGAWCASADGVSCAAGSTAAPSALTPNRISSIRWRTAWVAPLRWNTVPRRNGTTPTSMASRACRWCCGH